MSENLGSSSMSYKKQNVPELQLRTQKMRMLIAEFIFLCDQNACFGIQNNHLTEEILIRPNPFYIK